MKKRLLVIFAIIAMSLTSCTDATRAKLGGYGSEFKVELVNCDGTITHSWISSGKVLSEKSSDGYYFNDKETGRIIEVTGTLIISKYKD